MDSLDGTSWDILIAGSGIQQSLLALALSRSSKKVLHIDRNGYYGGSEAAFSLQEAEEWVERLGDAPSSFTNATVSRPLHESGGEKVKLSLSRSYSLSLAPQLIYSRSDLLGKLVSSRVYRQLEFLAVGSWWVYSLDYGAKSEQLADGPNLPETDSQSHTPLRGNLSKVPGGREDIFAAQGLDFKAKRSLMKFLRFIVDFEEQSELWEPYKEQPFSSFLSDQFGIPASLHVPFLALALSSSPPKLTTTEFALRRIDRHLRSMGVFGPGFGSVIPKWGGLAEIVQVACRANAVGGGVYMLGSGLVGNSVVEAVESIQEEPDTLKVKLTSGESVTTKWIVGGVDDLDYYETSEVPSEVSSRLPNISRLIAVVSSPLDALFPSLAEGAPMPAGAVVAFPSETMSSGNPDLPWVYISAHSSDSGECPTGQCVLYASVALDHNHGYQLLDQAVDRLLNTVKAQSVPSVLWSVRYQQSDNVSTSNPSTATTISSDILSKLISFPHCSLNVAFEDDMLSRVRAAWTKITGEEGEFMVFEDREEYPDEADDD